MYRLHGVQQRLCCTSWQTCKKQKTLTTTATFQLHCNKLLQQASSGRKLALSNCVSWTFIPSWSSLIQWDLSLEKRETKVLASFLMKFMTPQANNGDSLTPNITQQQKLKKNRVTKHQLRTILGDSTTFTRRYLPLLSLVHYIISSKLCLKILSLSLVRSMKKLLGSWEAKSNISAYKYLAVLATILKFSGLKLQAMKSNRLGQTLDIQSIYWKHGENSTQFGRCT